MNARYRHTQIGWTIIVCLSIALGLMVPIFVTSELSPVALIVSGVLLIVVLLFGSLTITVDADAIEARFGIGLIRKRVQLADIRYYEPVKTPWYYGWGIRLYPGGILYNVSGLHSVELWLRDGRRVRFGSDEPNAVCDALAKQLGSLEPLSPQERARIARRSKRWAVVILAVVVVVLGLLATCFVLESQPPKVSVADGKLSVASFMYGEDVALSSVKSVTLEPAIPRAGVRTNGFALGSTLRGHFRLADLGEGKLFIYADAPPYVLVKHANGYVLVNFQNPDQTRELYARIRAALPP